MRNKGFVLMETIVVIVVISVALLSIFSSYNKILSKVKTENKFDTSEYIYMTNYIKKNLVTLCGVGTINATTPSEIADYNEYSNCLSGENIFKVKKIYVLTGLNNLGVNVEKFDAYMIDYLRKLDVNESDKLIIVEYERPVLKTNGEQKKDSLGNDLYDTYIASLEW